MFAPTGYERLKFLQFYEFVLGKGNFGKNVRLEPAQGELVLPVLHRKPLIRPCYLAGIGTRACPLVLSLVLSSQVIGHWYPTPPPTPRQDQDRTPPPDRTISGPIFCGGDTPVGHRTGTSGSPPQTEPGQDFGQDPHPPPDRTNYRSCFGEWGYPSRDTPRDRTID